MKALAGQLYVELHIAPERSAEIIKALELAQALCSAIDNARRVIKHQGGKR